MPRDKDQNQNIIDKRREDILEASLYLFSLYGYKAVNMDDISKAALCSRTLVYHYFSTKENIFHELMKNVKKSIMKITNTLDFNAKAKDTLFDLLTKLLQGINSSTKESALFRLMLNLHLQGEELPSPPTLKPNLPINERPLDAIISYLIKKGQKEGDFYLGDTTEYTIAVISLIEGLSYNKIYLGKKFICPKPETIMNLLIKKEGNTYEK